MDSDARPGLRRLVHALRHGAEVTAVMLRVLDEAEQAAARIDWSGGLPKASVGPAGVTLGLPTFTDDPLLTRATVLHALAASVPLTAAGGLLTRVQSDEDGPKTLLPSMGAGGRPGGQGQGGGAAPPGGRGPVQQPPTSPGAVGGQRPPRTVQLPMFPRINMRHILRRHQFRPGRVSTQQRTPFPEGWGEADIEAAIHHVSTHATETGWGTLSSGQEYVFIRGVYNGVTIEVRYDPNTFTVFTAFPVFGAE